MLQTVVLLERDFILTLIGLVPPPRFPPFPPQKEVRRGDLIQVNDLATKKNLRFNNNIVHKAKDSFVLFSFCFASGVRAAMIWLWFCFCLFLFRCVSYCWCWTIGLDCSSYKKKSRGQEIVLCHGCLGLIWLSSFIKQVVLFTYFF